MLETNSQDEANCESLTDIKSASELRAQRVWRLSRVAWCTWLFFFGYFAYRAHQAGMQICAIEVLGITLILDHYRGSAHYRRAMNLVLGACGCGILMVSISDPGLRPTMLFFPVSILIASQILGVKEAFYWLLVNLLAQTVFFLIILGFNLQSILAEVDQIVMVYGVAVCTFFCCQQGEAFYRERTKGLVDLSAQLREKGEWLRKLATTDSLTGLMNRYQFLLVLRERTLESVENNRHFALVLVDMDGFKEINDTLGHPVGDRALTEVANRLRSVVNEQTVVARLGGDEFCLLLPDCDSAEEARQLAQKVRRTLKRSYSIDDLECLMDASFGIAICPNHANCPTELLAYADTAMFCAKSKRTGIEVYDSEMTRLLIENRKIQEKLSRALELGEFFLVYQPQVCLKTGKILAVEALMRWRHDGQLIPPIAFIPLLEKSRDIITVGSWVVQEACQQLLRWEEAGYDIGISVNLSSVQFNDPHFDHHVLAPIRRLGQRAQKIDFEITESLLVDNVATTKARLLQLRQAGASISIDDFGTGYSSLAYLKQFPLDRLKIDRAFVKGFPDDDDGLIAKSITVLSHALGLKVLAEGVETQAQLEFLESIGCDEYQGYYMSPPVTAEKVVEYFVPPISQRPSPPVLLAPLIDPGSIACAANA